MSKGKNMRKYENRPDPDKNFWILFDLDNGHAGSKQYCWWFETREQARAHKKHQHKLKSNAELAGPYKVGFYSISGRYA